MLQKEVSKLNLLIDDCGDWFIVYLHWESVSKLNPTKLALNSRLIEVLGCLYVLACLNSREHTWFRILIEKWLLHLYPRLPTNIQQF